MQIQNPETVQAMTNPRVIEAIQQIQNGMETLRREAPHLLPSGMPAYVYFFDYFYGLF